MNRAHLLSLCLAWTAPVSFAQDELSRSQAIAAAEALRIEWHRPAGEEGSALWGAGASYKARVDRELRFHPLLGSEAPAYVPFTWRTLSAGTAVEAEAIDAAPPRAISADRCERDLGGLVEIYDLREEGVEQSFRVDRAPAEGDLVIRGGITCEWRAESVSSAHQDLVFRDEDGRAVVTYGRATAFDAAGRSELVATSYDGETIELRVPGEWLRRASFPVLVDPLIFSQQLTWHTGPLSRGYVEDISIAIAEEPSGPTICFADSRVYSANDRDVYAWTCWENFAGTTRIFSDLTPGLDDRHPSVAYVADTQCWTLVFQRVVPAWSPSQRGIRAYLHSFWSITENSGVTFSMPRSGTESIGRPVIGGCLAGGGARSLVAHETDGDSGVLDVKVRTLDTSSLLFGAAQDSGSLPAGGLVQRTAPAITPIGVGGATGWVVVWEDQASSFSGRRVAGALFDEQGLRQTSAVLASPAAQESFEAPRVAGLDGRFAATWIASSTATGSTLRELRARRFDWGERLTIPVLNSVRSIDRGLLSTQSFEQGGIAFDTHTRSHWMAAYRKRSFFVLPSPGVTDEGRVARLGGTCAPIEIMTADPSWGEPSALAITFDHTSSGRFPIVYATQSVLTGGHHPVVGLFASHPAGASQQEFGVGCGAGDPYCNIPYIGNLGFTVYLATAGVTAQPAVLLVSLAPLAAPFPIDPVLMPGCALNLDPSSLVAALPNTMTNGYASQAVPIPDDLGAAFDACFQWIYLDPSANALGVAATRGLAVSWR